MVIDCDCDFIILLSRTFSFTFLKILYDELALFLLWNDSRSGPLAYIYGL